MTKQQSSGKAKGGKGGKGESAAPSEENRLAVGRVFVAEKYGGWQVRLWCASAYCVVLTLRLSEYQVLAVGRVFTSERYGGWQVRPQCALAHCIVLRRKGLCGAGFRSYPTSNYHRMNCYRCRVTFSRCHNVLRCCAAGGVLAAAASALRCEDQLFCRGCHHHGSAQERATEQSKPSIALRSLARHCFGNCTGM